jgi:hypothetical protein
MKTIMCGSTKKEGFYLKKEKRSFESGYSFWLGHKDENGNVSEQRITDVAYIILLSQNTNKGRTGV